jgi:hypothetical protein
MKSMRRWTISRFVKQMRVASSVFRCEAESVAAGRRPNINAIQDIGRTIFGVCDGGFLEPIGMKWTDFREHIGEKCYVTLELELTPPNASSSTSTTDIAVPDAAHSSGDIGARKNSKTRNRPRQSAETHRNLKIVLEACRELSALVVTKRGQKDGQHPKQIEQVSAVIDQSLLVDPGEATLIVVRSVVNWTCDTFEDHMDPGLRHASTRSGFPSDVDNLFSPKRWTEVDFRKAAWACKFLADAILVRGIPTPHFANEYRPKQRLPRWVYLEQVEAYKELNPLQRDAVKKRLKFFRLKADQHKGQRKFKMVAEHLRMTSTTKESSNRYMWRSEFIEEMIAAVIENAARKIKRRSAISP